MQALTREQLIERIEQLEAKVGWFQEQFRLAQARQFGPSSERMEGDSQFALLFNEAELSLDSDPKADEPQTVTYTRRKKSAGHREEMLKELPTETVEYRLPEEEQVCCACGGRMHEMSSECREELVIIPATLKVVKHIRYIYGCRHCERHEISVPIVRAPAPCAFIPKSLASASSVAYIMGMKYVEGVPLYRLEKHFERLDVKMPRSILSNWIIKGGEMLEVIYDRMHEKLLELSSLHADETPLQVLREDGRRAKSKSYMWLYRSGREGPPVVLYEYQPTREGEHPRRFLEGFEGYLHVDGYQGYSEMAGVKLVGCFSHARRKFTDVLKVLPKIERNDPKHLANVALRYINRLFEIERDLKDVSDEERRAAREELSKPLVEKFRTWLDEASLQALPKSVLGKAIGYCINQWSKLIVFLDDGRLEIDNNRAERSIKPFVIGRKNWLFSNTPRGAKTSAIIYSIVESAKENGLDPSRYLLHVFERLPEVDPADKRAIDSLLPWSENIQSALKIQHSLPLNNAARSS